MSFKRILVLVMALVMVVSACAPAAFAVTEATHEHGDDHGAFDHLDTLANMDLVEKYDEIKAMVEYVVGDIEENHEEYYAAGYAYALENGKIDAAIDAIDAAIDVIPEIDLDGIELTDELQAALQAELDAIVPTLEKVLVALENGDLDDFGGFASTLVDLKGEIYSHINGAYAILKQGKYDLDDDKLPGEFWSAISYVEDEVLPVVGDTAATFVEGVVAYVAENHEDYYAIGTELGCIALDVYKPFVEIVVMLDAYTVGGFTESMEGLPDVVLMMLLNNVESVDEAVAVITGIYNVALEKVLELNEIIEGALEYTDDVILIATTAYTYAIDALVQTFGSLENANAAVEMVFNYVMYLLEEYGILQTAIDNVDAFTEMVTNDVLEIVESCGGQKDSLVVVTEELVTYFVDLVVDFADYVENKLNGAVNGNYELKDDSLYVALGTSLYGEELAAMLNLSKKYFQFDLKDGEYLDKVAEADLITIKLDDGELYDFASAQVAGTIAELVRNNDRITVLREHELIGEYVNEIIADLGIDIEAQAEELDWSKYTDDEATLEMLDETLEAIKAGLINHGIPEYYYIDLSPLVEEAMADNGLAELPGITVTIDPIEVPVADLVAYAVENVIYAYAKFTNNLTGLLNNLEALAPDATIAIVGIDNPLEGMDVDFSEYGVDFVTFDDCVIATEALIEVLNAQLYVRGLIDNEVLFVHKNDAQAIYDALNVYCDHVYDDCEDEECNRCLAKRIAPGHTPGKFTSNNDATCTENGTESSICMVCGSEVIRTDYDSALGHKLADATCTEPATCTRKGCEYTEGNPLGHDYAKATCTAPRTCKRCGGTEGKANGHKWGDWETLKKASVFGDGLRQHTCKVCGHVEEEVVPFVPKYSPATIILVILSAIAFSVIISAVFVRKYRGKYDKR